MMEEDIDTFGDIYQERARYLLNIDEMMEEMMSQIQSGMTGNLKVEFPGNTGTVCCGALIDTDEIQEAEIKTRERFPVCSKNCGRFIETVNA